MPPIIAILCSLQGSDGAGGSANDSMAHDYSASVVRAGGAPVLIPCISRAKAIDAALGVAHGVIIAGGPDIDPALYRQQPHEKLGSVRPERDELDRRVVEYVLERPDLPSLSICRGIQALNVFAGGSLLQDIGSAVDGAIQHQQKAPGWYGTHEVRLAPDSALARTFAVETVRTNSFHHQAVADIAPGFEAVGWAADGIVEAIEREKARFCIGVQWHPERMTQRDDHAAALFAQLVTEAEEYRRSRAG